MSETPPLPPPIEPEPERDPIFDGPAVAVRQAAAPYRLTREEDVEDLIDDLRDALRRSRRSGGGYGVYRKDPSGAFMFQVEVHVKARQECLPPVET